MKVAVIQYPGSHGADDACYAYQQLLGQEPYKVWHQDEDLKAPDVVVVPGGYSFGDYLRPGALAKASPISGAVRKFAQDGGPVLGIGNGFQILCELGLLPGSLLANQNGKFMNTLVTLSVESTINPFTKNLTPNTTLKLPVANYFGRYYADRRTLRDLEDKNHIAFRYTTEEGDPTLPDNFNGSLSSIAGIISRHGNVLGLMPHPERAIEEFMGSCDGLNVLKSVLS